MLWVLINKVWLFIPVTSAGVFQLNFPYSIYIVYNISLVFYRFISFLQERTGLGLLHRKKLQHVIYSLDLLFFLQALPSGEKRKCDVGKKPENTSKNRYKTTFPCNYQIHLVENDLERYMSYHIMSFYSCFYINR